LLRRLQFCDDIVQERERIGDVALHHAVPHDVANVYRHGNKVFNLCRGLPICAMTAGMGSIGRAPIHALAGLSATPTHEAVQDGRIHIEKINGAPFLYTLKTSGPEFGAGIKYAVEKCWLEIHESGTYVRLMSAGEYLLSR
jgi:hypothetical protein